MAISQEKLQSAITLLETEKSHDLRLEITMARQVECCLDDSGGTEYAAKIYLPNGDTKKILWDHHDSSTDPGYLTFEQVKLLMAVFESQMAFSDTDAIEILTH